MRIRKNRKSNTNLSILNAKLDQIVLNENKDKKEVEPPKIEVNGSNIIKKAKKALKGKEMKLISTKSLLCC